ncbi:BTAD domain-containing putative transcriptional regulator [Nonomuraea sp. NPDC050536]|uniref:AfsR/SARP family transcriptional regulator n=1 Tax=Nonomuraea sp. NPDC050536 TaxID=3364366 RepID=UPI0037C9BB55
MAEGIVIRFLGPVTGVRDRSPLDLGTPRQQATLAVLASRIGRVVTMNQLIEALWGDDPPRTAEQSVYTYIAGLRRALEPGRGPREPSRLLVGASGGYVLHLPPHQVDVAVLNEHLDAARRVRQSGDHLEALSHLDEALALWRGPTLSGIPGPFAESERDRLEQLRADAVEWRAEALIELGRLQQALAPLRELTAQHPLRERARELTMLALDRLGRQAEALQVFEEARRVLNDELGIDPGEGLSRRHEAILRGGSRPPSESPIPRQLPRDLIGFVGRAQETLHLRGRLAPWNGSPPHPLVVISGAPGVGKSALAIRVAHLVKDRFPDGQLHVDLRGATPNVPELEPAAILRRLLRALGVDDDAVPADLDEAVAMWRDRLAGRRVLVVLDDAARLDQIRCLLAVPKGNSVLVTSRESLVAGDDCYQVHLARMTRAEATTLLSKLIGAGRVAQDPAAASTLVRLCEGLPLALKIAGARLADRPSWSLSSLTDRLNDERRRLSELEIGDLAVRSSLTSSWKALRAGPRPVDASAARVLSQLGVLHVPTVSAEVVAALSAMSDAEAERSLERLADAHLVERSRSGHYQLHDLVRLFVGELAPDDQHPALIRALSFYVVTARQACTLLDPHRVQAPAPEVDATPPAMKDRDAALRWLEAEETNIGHAAMQAMVHDDPAVARLGVALTFAVLWYQNGAHRGAELVMLNSAALGVGERLDDELIVRGAHSHLAGGLRMLSRLAEAVEHLRIQLEMARAAGDAFDEQRTLGNLAMMHVTMEDFATALDYANAQLSRAREIGSTIGERYSRLVAGSAYRGLGRLDEAEASLRIALHSARSAGDAFHEAQANMILGEVHLAGERIGSALGCLGQAVLQCRDVGYKIGELRCLVGMAQAHRTEGELDKALEAIDSAMPLARTLGNVRWERRAEREQAAVHEALGVPPMRTI